MAVRTKELVPTSNEVTLDRIRKNASPDYQARVPEATKAGIQAAMKAIMDDRMRRNEFIDALVNRIGLVVARNRSWTNPLAEFKQGMLEYGDTIEEYHLGLIKAKTYDPNRESLEREIFGTERPEVQSNFHKINRQDKYKVTVDENLLARAFLQEYGITDFVSQTMQSVTTSDNWDEFLVTCQLFAEYESNGGFYKVNVPDVRDLDSDSADSRLALRRMRSMADNLTFMSTKYNASGMPMAANRSDLVLFVTPEFNAAIDVEALAGAFNIGNAQLHGRIVPVPEEQFGISGAQAIMTTRDFFVIADTLYETASIFNPDNLRHNHWLHHHQIVSASRFVPSVLFTSNPVQETIELTRPVLSVSEITIENRDGETVTEVTRGLNYALHADAVTEPNDGNNDGVRWELSGANAPQTYLSQTGVLTVAGNESADSLTVTATSVWLDPDGLAQSGKSATRTFQVTGDPLVIWPRDTTGGAANAAGVMMLGMAQAPEGESGDGKDPEPAKDPEPVKAESKTTSKTAAKDSQESK